MGKSKKNHKKLYIVLAILLVVAALVFIRSGLPYLQRHYQTVHINEKEAVAGKKVEFGTGKALTVYFTRVGNSGFEDDVDVVASASFMEDNGRLIGNSGLLAQMANNCAGGDLYAITTEKKYPSSYNDTVSESAKENKQEGQLALAGELPDTSKYDIIIAVYLVWWGTIPKAVSSFFQQVDLQSKTIYVIATHGGSGAANSIEDLQKVTNGTVKQPVLEIYDKDVTKALPKVTAWIESLAGQAGK